MAVTKARTSKKAEAALKADAIEIVSRLIELSRQYLDQPADVDRARSGLTTPQISAITLLYDRGPLSLKDLSQGLGLSHSTVSGIVDRLERQGLARREVDSEDRRLTRISVTEEVQRYGREGILERRLQQLLPVLRALTAEQRAGILESMNLLRGLTR